MSVNQGTCTDATVVMLLHKALAEERREAQFSDLTVSVGGVDFKCHKLVLAAISGFFRSLFSSGMKEALEGRVVLHGFAGHDFSSDVFTDLMKWLYDGNLILSLENVFEILQLSDQLDIQVLFNECKEFLAQNLSVTNCVKVYNISVMHNYASLYKMSWDLLLKNFDNVFSSNDFRHLTFDCIKNLIHSPDLVSRSEDVVIENIFKWVRAALRVTLVESECEKNPHHMEKCSEIPLTKDDETDQTTIEDEDATQSDLCEGETSTKTEDKICSDNTKDKTIDYYLIDLLEATRYLLISGNCLWQTLANDPLVQNNPKGLAIQEQVVRYKSRLDSHQDGCIPAAFHRNTSHLKNVVLFYSKDMLLCIDKSGDFFLKKKMSETMDLPDVPTCLVYYDNKIYIQGQQRMLHVFTFEGMKWNILADSMQGKDRAVHMLPIGNELISINTSDNIKYIVESHPLQAYERSAWIRVGELSMQSMEIKCVTNIGSKLIIFWSQAGRSCITIECFDLTRLESYIVPHQLDSSDGLIAFKHEDEAFVLQQNGTLWRLSAQPKTPFIALKYEMRLWTFQRVVHGALLFDDTLLVFGDEPNDESLLKTDACLNNVFKRVLSFSVASSVKGFIHAVVCRSLIGKQI
ncbi:kelch-like 25 [Plakobranchus ocellatus]|uniref:Kelch-like 25 n=1 Tax=Plakobranchus ocellatus TaxID=259542 RepID=A0AAV3Z4A3_9GAST|nr:kelch-like 25 [Plakobranchus ocellatus]